MALYLDANATTPLAAEVLDAMRPYLAGFAGNASSRHAAGRAARQALDAARQSLAEALDAEPGNLVFTSGATEANALALRSLCPPGAELWLNPAEHPSVLEPARALANDGVTVRELANDGEGFVSAAFPGGAAGLPSAAAVQLANSETGALQDLPALAAAWPGVALHADAVQAPGRIPFSFRQLGVATLALGGHKLHGPPGIGALVIRPGVRLRPLLSGGHQQEGRRGGTEPVALVVGFAKAVELAMRGVADHAQMLGELRNAFVNEVFAALPDTLLNGPRDPARRLPNTANLSFAGAPSKALLLALDVAGVCCSAGSACQSGSALPSHVLLAMGLPADRVETAARFSFHREQTFADAHRAAAVVVATVRRVRAAFG